MYLNLSIIVGAFLYCSTAVADVELRQLKGGQGLLCITGEIKRSDVSQLKAMATPQGLICLNSNGGDVAAAIELGRFLRSRPTIAMVLARDTCASACVFVLAGSRIRNVEGRIGIHRPYLGNDNATTAEEQKANYAKIERDVKKYLEDMNINPSLYDDMIRISPGRVKFLSKQELERYGLSESDPYMEEAISAGKAKDLRISKAELLKREARIEAECEYLLKRRASDSYVTCANSILYGVPQSEYVVRDERANRVCGGKKGIEYRACRDRILLGSEQ